LSHPDCAALGARAGEYEVDDSLSEDVVEGLAGNEQT
jgi:hypothetical protein